MKALTLWQPWAWWVASGQKVIENRPWAAPKSAIGTEIAIHAGKVFDEDAYQLLRREDLRVYKETNWPSNPDGEHVQGAILGTAKVLRCFDYVQPPLSEEHARSPWAFGPHCWVLGDFRLLAEPIHWKGALGLWEVPEHILHLMRFLA